MDYSPTSFKGARPLEQPIRRWLDSKIAVSMHLQQLRELNLDDQNEVQLRPNFFEFFSMELTPTSIFGSNQVAQWILENVGCQSSLPLKFQT